MRRALVLVVDDDQDNREMYIAYLEDAGFVTAGAADGATAVEVARSLHPAVIVMDVSLPEMDGWEATRILKADPLTRGIKIFALTGHAEAKHRERATFVGCDLFIAKPCPPPELVEHIFRVLDGEGSEGSEGNEGASGA